MNIPITPLTFVIVCPLLFLAGFVDSIAGGGGLISLPAYLFAGLPVHYAIGTNKFSSTFGSSVAMVRWFRQGAIPLKLAAPSAAAAFIGSVAGAVQVKGEGTGLEAVPDVLVVLGVKLGVCF